VNPLFGQQVALPTATDVPSWLATTSMIVAPSDGKERLQTTWPVLSCTTHSWRTLGAWYMRPTEQLDH
jgi:hypothetical protein